MTQMPLFLSIPAISNMLHTNHQDVCPSSTASQVIKHKICQRNSVRTKAVSQYYIYTKHCHCRFTHPFAIFSLVETKCKIECKKKVMTARLKKELIIALSVALLWAFSPLSECQRSSVAWFRWHQHIHSLYR